MQSICIWFESCVSSVQLWSLAFLNCCVHGRAGTGSEPEGGCQEAGACAALSRRHAACHVLRHPGDRLAAGNLSNVRTCLVAAENCSEHMLGLGSTPVCGEGQADPAYSVLGAAAEGHPAVGQGLRGGAPQAAEARHPCHRHPAGARYRNAEPAARPGGSMWEPVTTAQSPAGEFAICIRSTVA